jgi:hypothetical protein
MQSIPLLVACAFFARPAFCQQQQPSTIGPTANFTNATGRTALLWSSIGLAVVTSLLQGLVTTIVAIAEDQSLWTFRFRIARFEHWWWTVISSLLTTSFSLIVLSFLSGNNNDALGVLALSTATTIAIVRYALPAWRNRRYIENRWLAWTGNSRTAVKAVYKDMCGDAAHWNDMAAHQASANAKIPSSSSDAWGFAIRPPKGLWQDPTALLEKFGENKGPWAYRPRDGTTWPMGPCVYDDGLEAETNHVSLLWGQREGFRPRVSRAINSMPIGLLGSRPFTIDGYNGEGLCLAFGILGRNKGLRAGAYVFDADDAMKNRKGIVRAKQNTKINAELENGSSWAPRPSKVMRSYYARAIDEQYGTFPTDFRHVATELALIFLDIEEKPLRHWLMLNLEQQSLDVNKWMSGRPIPASGRRRPVATNEELQTLYRASYTSMVLSLNYFAPSGTTSATRTSAGTPVRPDLICFALLRLAEHAVVLDPQAPGGPKWVPGPGVDAPAWWAETWVQGRLREEWASLKEGWREPAAWLLGLKSFPPELDVARWPEWPLKLSYSRGSMTSEGSQAGLGEKGG